MEQTDPRDDGVSRETLARLQTLCRTVADWSVRINLVSRGDLPHLWSRHVRDALQLLPLIPAGAARGIDLGSGAGFPGLVLAIATGIPFDLIEADKRKAAFLHAAAAATAAPVTIHATRIEAAPVAPAPLLTARALAPMAQLLAYADRLILPDGVCLFPKGANVADELTAAARQWHMQVDRFPSRTSPEGTILRITRLRRA